MLQAVRRNCPNPTAIVVPYSVDVFFLVVLSTIVGFFFRANYVFFWSTAMCSFGDQLFGFQLVETGVNPWQNEGTNRIPNDPEGYEIGF